MLLGMNGTEAALFLCNERLEYVPEHPDDGTLIRRANHWDSSAHLKERFSKARSVAHCLMALRNDMYLATSAAWLKLYKALVEPNAIFTSE